MLLNNKEINLAIFDMDGLLLDSEKINREKWIETAKMLGYEMTYEQWFGLWERMQNRKSNIFTAFTARTALPRNFVR